MANKEKQSGAAKTPIMRAQYIKMDIGSMTWKVISHILIVAFLSLVLSAVTGGGSLIGRIINVVLIVSFFMLELMEGGTRGEHDVTMSRMVESRLKEKNVQPEPRELARCYGPVKAFIALGLGAGVFFLLSVIVAVAARPYTYTMQDLPTWMSAYSGRDDIMRPLAAYGNAGAATAVDYIRIVVRACILPFVNLFGDVQEASYIIDRLSPLFMLLLPISYPLGYLMGPSLYEKRIRQNEEAKKATIKRIRKKNKKERRAREQMQIKEKHPINRQDEKRKDNQLI